MRNRRKKRVAPAGSRAKARRWQQFFNSKAVVAILPVLVAGLLTLINAATRKDAGSTEEQVKLQATYQTYLERQRETVSNALGLMDRCVAASGDLIALTGPDFDPSRYRGLESQRVAIRDKFNDCVTSWNEEYNKQYVAISFYHGGQPAVVEAWAELQKATTRVMECSQQWYVSHNTAPGATAGICQAEVDEQKGRMAAFRQQVSASHQKLWQKLQSAGGPSKGAVGLVEK